MKVSLHSSCSQWIILFCSSFRRRIAYLALICVYLALMNSSFWCNSFSWFRTNVPPSPTVGCLGSARLVPWNNRNFPLIVGSECLQGWGFRWGFLARSICSTSASSFIKLWYFYKFWFHIYYLPSLLGLKPTSLLLHSSEKLKLWFCFIFIEPFPILCLLWFISIFFWI